jgi:hypothetical protein
MSSEQPIGGFPSIIKKNDQIKPIESTRSFGSSTVNISKILDKKQKDDFFIAFDETSENGAELYLMTPNKYTKIKS